VAEIFPKRNGSSTIGVKKSVVEINPLPFPKSITAASSLFSLPTINLGSLIPALPAKILSRTSGEILQPQPAPGLNCVSLIFSIYNLSYFCELL
jgi:hypothetical protein